MKTIKVIDLLNQIANGEEVPKKIKYQGNNFKYEEYCKDYKCISDEEYGFLLKDDIGDNYCYPLLNHEVEIIEEVEELTVKKASENFTKYSKSLNEGKEIEKLKINIFSSISFIKQIEDKLNEVIEAVNKLNK